MSLRIEFGFNPPYTILHTPYFLTYTGRMNRYDMDRYKLPDSPGVYFFRDARRHILYIGKATSLRDRVRSYFSANLTDARSTAIATMIAEASSITWKKTDSVLEALILEANLIKKHQPKYNSRDKDDKSFNYLVITKEDFPCVLVVRGRELFGLSLKTKNLKLKTIYGPYTQGRALVDALKIVRKIFPFRDRCIPCTVSSSSLCANSHELAHKRICKPCFNLQIGLCPGVCSGEISKKDYARIIRHIRTFFSGKIKILKRMLEREMLSEAKAERYENAKELRRQIDALNHIRDVSLINDESRISAGGLSTATNARDMRIEAYDVAHTAGTETVAVMTVVNNGELEKESYRKFKIKSVKNDDAGALKEVLSRRLAHNEWPLPRVFVVDGGLAQLRVAKNLLKDAGLAILVVGVVKNEFHKPERLIGDSKSIESSAKDILLANAEAHRFAVDYHRKKLRTRQ